MKKQILVQAALCGLFTASLGLGQATKEVEKEKKAKPKKDTDANKMGECHGINACKGKGECGGEGEGHACAGNNTCKGKGWLKMSKKDCAKKNGKFK